MMIPPGLYSPLMLWWGMQRPYWFVLESPKFIEWLLGIGVFHCWGLLFPSSSSGCETLLYTLISVVAVHIQSYSSCIFPYLSRFYMYALASLNIPPPSLPPHGMECLLVSLGDYPHAQIPCFQSAPWFNPHKFSLASSGSFYQCCWKYPFISQFYYSFKHKKCTVLYQNLRSPS